MTTENDQGCSLDAFQNNLHAKRLPIAHDSNQKCLMHDATHKRSEDEADAEEFVWKPLSGEADKATVSSPEENGGLSDEGHSPSADREEKYTNTLTYSDTHIPPQQPPTYIPSKSPLNHPLTQLHTEIQLPTELLLIPPPGIPTHLNPTLLVSRLLWEKGYTSGLFSGTRLGTCAMETTYSQNIEPITTGRYVGRRKWTADTPAESREHILIVEQPPAAKWSQKEIASVQIAIRNGNMLEACRREGHLASLRRLEARRRDVERRKVEFTPRAETFLTARQTSQQSKNECRTSVEEARDLKPKVEKVERRYGSRYGQTCDRSITIDHKAKLHVYSYSYLRMHLPIWRALTLLFLVYLLFSILVLILLFHILRLFLLFVFSNH